MLLIWCCSVYLILVFITFLHYKRMLSTLEDFPHLGPPLPLVGHLLYFIDLAPEDMWYYLLDMYHAYGRKRISVFRLGHHVIFSFTHPETTECLLKTTANQTKGFMYDSVHNWLGKGLLTSTGHRWRMKRKMLTIAFHFEVLVSYLGTFNKVGYYHYIFAMVFIFPENGNTLVTFVYQDSVNTRFVQCRKKNHS